MYTDLVLKENKKDSWYDSKEYQNHPDTIQAVKEVRKEYQKSSKNKKGRRINNDVLLC